ncbi:MAG: cardiolipin synthase [Brevibacterium aurantiacum]|uniref:Cardiolipin synthase n=4 Tax=Brevibacterium TaxID=1696 RepID=A0A2A3ZGD8_BREAU|nr:MULTISPECIES: cardiolipin synthase [Brevibacterium]PCC50563.1 cardiolipin synthase [Brevibacterium aurantiacum]SMX80507.1 cardiolipin synthetase 2 [Brevibacterium antiquum CNRZ 918]SMX99303.1 cardiolipin synthetase 2 [Brevibacterium aurantiacum]HCG55227.1 cardiolipin synthase [Brevibacterium sp.]
MYVDYSVVASVLGASWIVIEYVVKIIAVGVVPEDRRPSSSSAWLLLILFVPIVGIPLFLMLGSPYINRRRARIQAQADELMHEGADDLPDVPPSLQTAPGFVSIAQLGRRLTALPMVTGDSHGVTSDYEASIKRMSELVDEAREYVHVEIYIMAWDSTTDVFFRALERAADRGVKVRVLFDHIGSRKYPGFHRLGKRLTKGGIDWHLMLPFIPWRGKARRIDLRNHRKLLVVDGKKAMMGSQNMIDSSYLKKSNVKIGRAWHDIMVELSGPIVAAVEAVFATDWYTECDEALGIRTYDRDAYLPDVGGQTSAMQLVPSGPGFTTEPNLKVFTSLIYLAQKRLAIVSPYFVPDESLLAAVVTAAERGVDVELYVSEQADQFMVDFAQASYYRSLLEVGVRIFRYPKPQVLHTKCLIVDDEYAVMGSSNLDMRSFGLNYEISLLTTGGDLVHDIAEVVAEYQAESSELSLDEWEQRPYIRRYLESVMRLTSSLQ